MSPGQKDREYTIDALVEILGSTSEERLQAKVLRALWRQLQGYVYRMTDRETGQYHGYYGYKMLYDTIQQEMKK